MNSPSNALPPSDPNRSRDPRRGPAPQRDTLPPHGDTDALDPREPYEISLDSMLSESLGNVAPPDFSQHHAAITEAAMRGHAWTGRFSPEELDWAVDAADVDQAAAEALVSTALSRSRNEPLQASRREANHAAERARWMYLALAASIVGTLLAISWFQRPAGQANIASSKAPATPENDPRTMPKVQRPGTAEEQLANASSPSSQRPRPSEASPIEPRSIAANATPPAANTPEANQLPSALQNGSALAVASPSQSTSSQPSIATARLALGSDADREVTSVIDQQFAHLWERIGVDAQPSTDRERLENRLAMMLLGRLPTASERQSIRQKSSDSAEENGLPAMARRWIESEEFDRYWAGLLADHYLGRLPATEAEAPARLAYQAWLEKSIRSNRALGEIERQMIVAPAPAASDASTPASPESHWLAHWMARRAEGATSLVSASGALPSGWSEAQSAALDSISLQTARWAGRSDAACLRCHHVDGEAAPIAIPQLAASAPKDAGSVPTRDLFASIAAAMATGIRNGKPELYVNDGDQRMVLVTPTLPDGKRLPNGTDPRTALGDWFAQTAAPRAAVIDFAWSQLLGQPLVPGAGLESDEGLEERRDLLQFLATKAQQRQHGLKPIVYWIAMSAPTAMREPLNDPIQFLKMDAPTLARYESEKRVFARYSGLAQRLEPGRPVAMLSQWIQPDETSDVDRTLLAQPSNPRAANPSTANPATPWSQWSPARLAFEMSSAAPEGSLAKLSQQLASSSLSNDQIVEHAFLVSQSRLPQAWERSAIGPALDGAPEERSRTVLRLLTAMQWY